MATFEFLIVDYTKCGDDLSAPELRIVGFKDLLDEIDKAGTIDAIKIAVHEIHECVLDWT